MVPGDLLQRAIGAAHLGVEQAAFQVHGFTERRAFHAQPAVIGRVLRVARDLDLAVGTHGGAHAAADAAVRAGGGGGGGQCRRDDRDVGQVHAFSVRGRCIAYLR
ncbi:hypothetical protein D9M72_576050 [compost metagenome]